MKNDPVQPVKADPYRIAYLVAGFIRNTLDDEERDELDEWVVASDDNMQLFAELTDERKTEESLAQIDDIDKQADLKKLLSRTAAEEQKKKSPSRFWLYAAAACIIFLTGLFMLYRYTTLDSKKSATPALVGNDIQPAGNKATLTTEDGSVIDLATMQNGLIKQTNSSQINKLNDKELMYMSADAIDGETVYHVLTVKGGGPFSLILADGTKLWLNAASSLRYPTRFTGTERTVELIGEAYFEVAKNKQPFVVKTAGNNIVRVLGTHFNVKAYTDETTEAITLLEGSVEVKAGDKKLKLEADQQAVIQKNDLVLNSSPNTESVMAWKNRLFKFTDAPIEEIMNQVKRWYAVAIVYETKTTHHFNATISRDTPVSKLLHYLELTGQVHFKIEGNKIIVMK